PESHTGATLAAAFHCMLVNHGLENKIMAVNADNASSNDTQTDSLDSLPNSFDSVNRVRCFNHTLQLSVKALLHPFSSSDDDKDSDTNDMPELEALDDEEGEDDEEEEGANDEDNEDPFDDLSEDERAELLESTKTVRTILSKVRKLSFAIINLTTKALPVWNNTCAKHNLKRCLIPRDVKTRWNSTFDMLKMVVMYRAAVDTITGEKTLNLRRYELFDEDWKVIDDLVMVLE
ncbi:hypothetical protein H0H92_012625, partial [Tricholoma furcatifolium]